MNNLFDESEVPSIPDSTPFVYLVQYSNEPIYKIGYTSRSSQRLYDIRVSLPYAAEYVHKIHTDSPEWLERKWHQRFWKQRRLGSGIWRASEWFDLSHDDVAEFKSHKRINQPPNPQLQIDFNAIEIEIEKERQQQSAREAAIFRILNCYDKLGAEHPHRTIRLANSCNFQIANLEVRVSQLMAKHFSEERAIEIWEQDALLAANAKVRGS